MRNVSTSSKFYYFSLPNHLYQSKFHEALPGNSHLLSTNTPIGKVFKHHQQVKLRHQDYDICRTEPWILNI